MKSLTNSARDLIDKIASAELPVWALIGLGLLLAVLAFKVAKGVLKLVFVAAALAAFVGAGWWFLHQQGRL